ncbi:MAG TPA: hypothetical protein VKQ73_11920 [Stellaceae bacterium]|nr:hypothetical protein [Stellaceae bacterium]
MIYVSIEEMTANIDKLVQAVKTGGQQIVITDQNVPFATLHPIRQPGSKRAFGALKGQFSVGPEFFEPLPEDELAAWE